KVERTVPCLPGVLPRPGCNSLDGRTLSWRQSVAHRDDRVRPLCFDLGHCCRPLDRPAARTPVLGRNAYIQAAYGVVHRRGSGTSLAAWLLAEAFPADKPLPSLVEGFMENRPAIMSWWALGLLVVSPIGEE